jgi:hypothetical protein
VFLLMEFGLRDRHPFAVDVHPSDLANAERLNHCVCCVSYRTACPLFEQDLVQPYHQDGGLNGWEHVHRNREYQQIVLDHFARTFRPARKALVIT